MLVMLLSDTKTLILIDVILLTNIEHYQQNTNININRTLIEQNRTRL
jgi:hypothetical protein